MALSTWREFIKSSHFASGAFQQLRHRVGEVVCGRFRIMIGEDAGGKRKGGQPHGKNSDDELLRFLKDFHKRTEPHHFIIK